MRKLYIELFKDAVHAQARITILSGTAGVVNIQMFPFADVVLTDWRDGVPPTPPLAKHIWEGGATGFHVVRYEAP